jgi:hypothetical protein
LLHVADAGYMLGLVARLIKRGQKHCGQNSDYGDDHQKFN